MALCLTLYLQLSQLDLSAHKSEDMTFKGNWTDWTTAKALVG